jgi:hypothetical protein
MSSRQDCSRSLDGERNQEKETYTMKKMQSGHRAGGGIGSKQTTRYVPAHGGHRSREIRHEGVSQIGSSMGNHVTEHGRPVTKAVEKVRGPHLPHHGPGAIRLGNEIATEGVGVGSGRKVYASGSQQRHGEPAGQRREQNPGGDILREFGPDSSRPKKR